MRWIPIILMVLIMAVGCTRHTIGPGPDPDMSKANAIVEECLDPLCVESTAFSIRQGESEDDRYVIFNEQADACDYTIAAGCIGSIGNPGGGCPGISIEVAEEAKVLPQSKTLSSLIVHSAQDAQKTDYALYIEASGCGEVYKEDMIVSIV